MGAYDDPNYNDDLDNSPARRRELYWKRWNRGKFTWKSFVGALVLLVGTMGLGYVQYWFKHGRKAPVAAPTAELPADATFTQGDAVLVEWNGKWYRSTVLRSNGDTIRIHYTGWEDKWDEDVPRSRIRLP